jgi:hypothetical protein
MSDDGIGILRSPLTRARFNDLLPSAFSSAVLRTHPTGVVGCLSPKRGERKKEKKKKKKRKNTGHV